MLRFLIAFVLTLSAFGVSAQEATDKYAVISPVQTQLDGYNTGDIELFLSAYSDSVKVYNYPDQLQYQGKEKMRENYAGMFTRLPDLHCRLVNRVVMGNRVVDHESVIFQKGENPLEVMAIYTVKDGYIIEVRFMR